MMIPVKHIVSALHEVHFGRFYWWDGDEKSHQFTLLGLGWGSFLVLIREGRPTVGVQFSYGKLALWFGPWHRRFGL